MIRFHTGSGQLNLLHALTVILSALAAASGTCSEGFAGVHKKLPSQFRKIGNGKVVIPRGNNTRATGATGTLLQQDPPQRLQWLIICSLHFKKKKKKKGNKWKQAETYGQEWKERQHSFNFSRSCRWTIKNQKPGPGSWICWRWPAYIISVCKNVWELIPIAWKKKSLPACLRICSGGLVQIFWEHYIFYVRGIEETEREDKPQPGVVK